MEQVKTWVDLHEGEKFGDGGVRDQGKQCKNCMFRDKTIVKGEEVGWYKSFCKLYNPPNYKPNEISNNTAECEFYEKE